MSLFKVFDVAGSAMSAESLRLNVTASNLANAESVAGSPGQAYKARQPVFAAALRQASDGGASVGVRVRGIVESQAPATPMYMPDHPLADAKGYVYRSNVSVVDEMVNMISASRSYQSDAEVMNTSKDLLLQTLKLGG